MFGSAVLEVILGLTCFFAAFSFGCCAALELLESIRFRRSKQLAEALERLLGAELLTRFYEHGLIRSLSRAGRPPQHVPPRSFALAILDLLAIEGSTDRAKIEQTAGELSQVLRISCRETAGLEQIASRLEHWFEAAMARCSDGYRRRMRWAAFGVAFATAAALNADALEIASVLYADSHLRLSSVVQPEGDGQMLQTLERRSKRVVADRLPSLVSIPVETGLLPLGWENSRLAARTRLSEQPWNDLMFWFGPVLSKFLGLLITAVVVSLGAGVCFDLLSRLTQRPKLPASG